MDRHSKAGIVIVTRNREADLRYTLDKLAAQPAWNELPLLVLDDISDSVGPDYFSYLEKRSTIFMRGATREGCIVGRNTANFEAPFEYIFSLDDDSCFIDPKGPARAIAYMDEHPKVAALSFPQASEDSPPNEPAAPVPCASFVGCAHLIRKNIFLALGGYRKDFFHLGEEAEYSRRLWSSGYEVHAFPACRIHHHMTSTARHWRLMGYYGPRNRMYTHLLSTPMYHLPREVLGTIGSFAKLSLKTGPLMAPFHFAGLASGFFHGIEHLHDRWPMNSDLYRKLVKLPRTADEI